MNKKAILITVLLLGTTLLAYLIQDFVQQVLLQPLTYIYWSLRQIYRTVPEIIWWVLFLGILMVIAVRSLTRRGPAATPMPEDSNYILSQPQAWMRWVKKKNQGEYSKWHFAHKMSNLALALIANRERLTPELARDELLAGGFDLPERIRSYLVAGSLPKSFSQYQEILANPQMPISAQAIDLNPEEIVAFLEAQLQR